MAGPLVKLAERVEDEVGRVVDLGARAIRTADYLRNETARLLHAVALRLERDRRRHGRPE